MELPADSHKRTSSLSSYSNNSTLSEDYIDSPPLSNDAKSPPPLAGLASRGSSDGDFQSDDQSSLGTLEGDDDHGDDGGDVTRGKGRPDLRLTLQCPPSEQRTQTMVTFQTAAGEDDEAEFGMAAYLPRRSTSLKTCKTPPPGCKKEVRFADALGLDLESVKHIMNTSEPPIVPVSARRHLVLRSDADTEPDFTVPFRRRLLHSCFSQPGMSWNFAERIAERRVSLETCLVTSGSIDGVIRVANIAYEKRVSVRYTLNGWLEFTDVPASYIHGSSSGSTDQFRFTITLPNNFGLVNNAVEFSVRYEVGAINSSIYWDSNFGANYRVECYVS